LLKLKVKVNAIDILKLRVKVNTYRLTYTYRLVITNIFSSNDMTPTPSSIQA